MSARKQQQQGVLHEGHEPASLCGFFYVLKQQLPKENDAQKAQCWPSPPVYPVNSVPYSRA